MRKLLIGAGLAGLALASGWGCSLGPTSDGDSPVLVITSPTTDTVAGAVPFSADAQDASGIAKVRFSVDNALLLEDFTAPYSTVWQTTPAAAGVHTLKVEAIDGVGNSASVTKVVVVTDARQ